MATYSKGQITEENHTHIWVRWQKLRRNSAYQVAVKTFPQAVDTLCAQYEQQRTALGPLPSVADEAAFTAYVEQYWGYSDWMRACQTVLTAYEQLSQWVHTGLTAAQRSALVAMKGRAYATVSTKIGRILGPCRLSKVREAVPLLAAFQQQWGIEFPVEPDIPYAIRPLLWSSREVQAAWTLDDTTRVGHLTVSFQLDVPQKWITDAVEGVVADLKRKLPRDDKYRLPSERDSRLRERKYYEELFQIYDLHQAGKSDAAIARQLWLEEFKSKPRYGAKNPVLQRVHDRLKAVRNLMDPSPTQK